MKTRMTTLFASAVLCLASAFAVEPSVSDVSVRQRWPWDSKVDIDYTLSGTNCDIVITASCDGMAPFELDPAHMTGDLFDVKPGAGHVTWDPVAAGYGDKTLAGFKVTVSPLADISERTYLVLDLLDGSCEYLASPPEKGWLDSENGYTKTKIVFRRIPGGTFNMGYPKDIRDHLVSLPSGANFNHDRYLQHEVTLSSDYYMAVTLLSKAQYCCLTGLVENSSFNPNMSSQGQYASCSYDKMRGIGSTWPNGDKYAVKEGSILHSLRNLTKGKLPAGWVIDLPTSAQWERACKADMPDNWIYYTGGTVDDDATALTNIVNGIASCKISPRKSGSNIMSRAPNGWGLYDMLGLQQEFTLDYDWQNPSGAAYEPMTDPVGPSSGTKRILRGGNNDSSQFYAVTPVNWTTYASSTGWATCRLAIHINPIK